MSEDSNDDFDMVDYHEGFEDTVKLQVSLPVAHKPPSMFEGALVSFDDCIKELAFEAHKTEIARCGENAAFVCCVRSEALEEIRSSTLLAEIRLEDKKPCGYPVELADVVIRILGHCGRFSLPIADAIRMKMAYNKTQSDQLDGKVLR